MGIGNFVTSQEVDLTNCDREVIHFPGSIQPHGVLLALQEPQLKILQVSNNTEQFFGIPAKSLINQSLKALLSPYQINRLKHCISQNKPEDLNPIRISVKTQQKSLVFDDMSHWHDGILITGCD